MSESLGDKKRMLKELIKQLHAGMSPDEVKEKFKEVLKSVDQKEISQVEEELIKEGMTREEIQKLCDVHLAVFRESLEKETVVAPPGHPIHILMEEHKMVLKFADELINVAKQIKGTEGFDSIDEEMKQLTHIVEHFKASESHYTREENVLFPYIEKHGVTEPPAIMWMEHDKIREIEKNLYKVIDARKDMNFKDFAKQLEEVSLSLADMLSSHFYKENNILFPTALKIIEGTEWTAIRNQFDELGYCCFTPESARKPISEKGAPVSKPEAEGMITFETGIFTKDELETLLDTLPVDVTFVDKDDRVRYFSQSKDRIFVRTKAVLGRKVQQCHPQKSIHVVNQILDDFRHGRRDVAEFWIPLNGRLIYIRYFAVHRYGEYLGTLEVTQDITDVKKIEGEKRLL